MNEIEYERMQEEAALSQCAGALQAKLKEHDTGRWDWDRIHCCLTGKDADLEPWGQQGIELVRVTEDNVYFNVHTLITFVGDDVSLNLRPEEENDDAAADKAREIYLERAQSIVWEAPGRCEWDGDDWICSDQTAVEIPWVMKDDDIDYEATARAVVDKANEVVKPWEEECVGLNNVLNQLSGWIDDEDNKCPPGKPGPGACWINEQPEEKEDEPQS